MNEAKLNVDEVFDMYTKVLLEGFNPRYWFTSISQLQEWRPDFTDAKLADLGFIRGVHIVAVHDGVISPMIPPE